MGRGLELGFASRVVLVTGASSGIGAHLAEAYGREQARVAITYRRNRDGAERTAERVRGAGGDAMTVRFDLAEPDTAASAVAAAVERWQRLDVLVANAVSWPQASPGGRFEALDPAAWQAGLNANIAGTFAVVQAALVHMRPAAWGRILFVSSGIAEEGMPGGETYGAAKAALHGLARSLAWGAGGDHILVNVLAAGLTLTDRNRATLPPGMVDGIAARTPLRRLSTPDQVAAPALFLTSAANTSITGEVIREGLSTGRSAHV